MKEFGTNADVAESASVKGCWTKTEKKDKLIG